MRIAAQRSPPSISTTRPATCIGPNSETAAMIDASADPRAEALDSLFTELADADSVEVFEYSAKRGVVLAPGRDPTGPPVA